MGCEQTSPEQIDPSVNPPVLLQASVTPATVNSDTINVGATRKPEDVLPIALIITAKTLQSPDRPISNVQIRVLNPNDYDPLAVEIMRDDGTAGDQTRGDGIYTAKTSVRIHRVEIGVFKVEVVALGSNGSRSNTILLPLTVFRGNHAPLVVLFEAPDTLQLKNETQLLTLRVRTSDEDGHADVTRVIFNSYRPDGTPSSGNPFQMYDDGGSIHGDEKAGDGIYSLIIELPPTTQTGTYRFEFQAFDRSNIASSTLFHSVTVKP
jgi:hypothetical protein